MFTQNFPADSMRGQLDDDLPGQKPTSGGSSDTEKKDPTARPTGCSPSAWAAMTVTPVGKWPRTWRNRASSMGGPAEGVGSLTERAG
jgi:hypothetical protein